MPVCEVCRNEYQLVARFCPNCGAPLSALAARLREGRVPAAPAEDIVEIPDVEDAETEA